MMLISSDPYITSLGPAVPNTTRQYPQEALQMILSDHEEEDDDGENK